MRMQNDVSERPCRTLRSSETVRLEVTAKGEWLEQKKINGTVKRRDAYSLHILLVYFIQTSRRVSRPLKDCKSKDVNLL